jgi:hypothetical protein
MRVSLGVTGVASFLRRRWRILLGLCLAGAGVFAAITRSDEQGRADLPYGYAVRMTCEDDPESHLWSGGCERIAADIARTDPPSLADLYWAFVAVHHSPIPSPATARRFASVPCDADFKLDDALEGTRFVLSPEKFASVCSLAQAREIMDEIDARDRALLTIERAGLSYSALAAGALANLTEPLALLSAAVLFLALWIL